MISKLIRDQFHKGKVIAYLKNTILVFFTHELRSLANLFGLEGQVISLKYVKYSISLEQRAFKELVNMPTLDLEELYPLRLTVPYRLASTVALSTFFFSVMPYDALALPEDTRSVLGNVTFSQSGKTLNISTSSQRSIAEYQRFNIAQDETVNFNLVNKNAAILNRVVGDDPSHILGKMNSNGNVVLVNPSGVFFGKDAQVNVQSLTASTLDISNQDFVNGQYTFKRSSGVHSASIVNHGQINVKDHVVLIGGAVENTGTIRARDIHFAVGDQVTVNVTPSVSAEVTVDKALEQEVVEIQSAINNSGTLSGQNISLQAKLARSFYEKTVNNEGFIEARGFTQDKTGKVIAVGQSDTHDALVENSGVIDVSSVNGNAGSIQLEGDTTTNTGELFAVSHSGGQGGQVHVLGDQVQLLGQAQVDASGDLGGGEVLIGGDYQGQGETRKANYTDIGRDVSIKANAMNEGDGGHVILWAEDRTRFYGTIEAHGGAKEGDGGFVETSGKQSLTAFGKVNTLAPNGQAGTWLLDPTDIRVVSSGSDTNDLTLVDQYADSDLNGSQSSIDVAAINAATSNVVLQANQDIYFDTDVNITTAAVGLTAQAKRNINVSNNITTNNGNITLTADSDSNGSGAITVSSGKTINSTGGNITLSGLYINGSGDINAGSGDISLTATNPTTTASFKVGTLTGNNVTLTRSNRDYSGLTSTIGDINATGVFTLTTNSDGDTSQYNFGNITANSIGTFRNSGSISTGTVTVASGAINIAADYDNGGSGSLVMTGLSAPTNVNYSLQGSYLNLTGININAGSGDISLTATGPNYDASFKVGTLTGDDISLTRTRPDYASVVSTIGNITASGIFSLTTDSNAYDPTYTFGNITANSIGTFQNTGHLNINNLTYSIGSASIEADYGGSGTGTFTLNGAVSTNNNDLTIMASQLALPSGSSINTGNGALTLRPSSNKAIQVAGSTDQNDTGALFSVSAAELGRITSASLTIGDYSKTGGLTVAGNLNVSGTAGTTAGAYTLNLVNGGNITSADQSLIQGSNAINATSAAAVNIGTFQSNQAQNLGSVSGGSVSLYTYGTNSAINLSGSVTSTGDLSLWDNLATGINITGDINSNGGAGTTTTLRAPFVLGGTWNMVSSNTKNLAVTLSGNNINLFDKLAVGNYTLQDVTISSSANNTNILLPGSLTARDVSILTFGTNNPILFQGDLSGRTVNLSTLGSASDIIVNGNLSASRALTLYNNYSTNTTVTGDINSTSTSGGYAVLLDARGGVFNVGGNINIASDSTKDVLIRTGTGTVFNNKLQGSNLTYQDVTLITSGNNTNLTLTPNISGRAVTVQTSGSGSVITLNGDLVASSTLTLDSNNTTINANGSLIQTNVGLTIGDTINTNGNSAQIVADADGTGTTEALVLNNTVTTGGGNLTLRGAQLDINNTINAGSGTVNLYTSSNKAIQVAGSTDNNDSSSLVDISAAELGRITAGGVNIGETSKTGGLTVGGDINLSTLGYDLDLNNGGNITSTNRFFTLGAKTLDVIALGDVSITYGNGALGMSNISGNNISITRSGAHNTSNASFGNITAASSITINASDANNGHTHNMNFGNVTAGTTFSAINQTNGSFTFNDVNIGSGATVITGGTSTLSLLGTLTTPVNQNITLQSGTILLGNNNLNAGTGDIGITISAKYMTVGNLTGDDIAITRTGSHSSDTTTIGNIVAANALNITSIETGNTLHNHTFNIGNVTAGTNLNIDTESTLIVNNVNAGTGTVRLITDNNSDTRGVLTILGALNLNNNDTTLQGSQIRIAGSGINAGTGDVTVSLVNSANNLIIGNGTTGIGGSIIGDTVSLISSGGTIFTNDVLANSILLVSANDITLNTGTDLVASASGNSLVLASTNGSFINNAGASVLSASNGRWLVYSDNPTDTVEGGLTYNKLYNKSYVSNPPNTIGAGNYILYSIAPILTVTADDKSKAYGSANPILTGTITGFIDGDTTSSLTGSANYSTSATTSSDVGSYAINASVGTLAGLGYQFTSADGTLTVNKALITVTADDKSKTYGSVNPSLTAQYSGFVLGQDTSVLDTLASVSTSATTSSDAGSYGITASGALDNNYSFSYVDGTLTVNKALITVTADDKSKYQGQRNPLLTAHYSGFVLGEDVNDLTGRLHILTNAKQNSPSGYYNISASGFSGVNYDIQYVNGTLSILPLDKHIAQPSMQNTPAFQTFYTFS